MEPSIPGLGVCAALLALGWWLRAPAIVAVFAALPFGSTAFCTLTALGGSTPLIYTLMTVLLVLTTVVSPTFRRDLGTVFRQQPTAWVVFGLFLYVVIGAQLLPRMFAGETSSFVILRGGVLEQPLAPTSGNITQAGYFALGVLAYYCSLVLLLHRENLAKFKAGFFACVILNVAFGIIDFGGKLTGLGDVLFGIRTANYSFLTEVSAGSFWRIVGAHPEASAFAIWSLSGLAFAFVHWRTTGSRWSLLLAVLSFLLTVLSTSTTAYVGLGVLGLFYALAIGRSALGGRLNRRDLLILALVPVLFVVVFAVAVANEKALEPAIQLFETMVLNKAQSASGQERGYWNARSLAAVSDTYALGVGLGSSRASSWLIALVSQLGLVGAALMALLVIALLSGPGYNVATRCTCNDLGFYRATRASGLAYLVGSGLSGAAADPGILFFLCLAIVISSRRDFERPVPRPEMPRPTMLPHPKATTVGVAT